MSPQGARSAISAATQAVPVESNHAAFLATAIIDICNENRVTSCRALLDPGSQINFVTSELVKRTNLKIHNTCTSIAGIGNKIMSSSSSVELHVKSRINAFSENLTCLVIPKITQKLPQTFSPSSMFNIPKGVRLADPNFNVPADIDLLIGADLCWRLLCVGQIKPTAHHPTLQKTLFGWIVAGHSSINAPLLSNGAASLLSTNDQLNITLNKFWHIESILCKPPHSHEERICEKHFHENHTRNHDGRFIVRLPKKEDIFKNLGSSFDNAKRQFLSLERRLTSQPLLREQYSQFIDEYIKLNHMREVNAPHSLSPNSHTFYLPHHPVMKETSTTTKLRVVFNASCKSSTGVSLNDTLMVGPTVQQDLLSIFIRFRTHPIALIADIEKMYRQVLVHEEDTPLQRIIWRKTPNEPLKVFELLTVTYGTASASYLAIEAMRTAARDKSAEYPLGSSIILRDFYVDDLTSGAISEEEAKNIKSQTTEILNSAGFPLRKWASNLPSLSDVNNTEREFQFSDNSDYETRTLGIVWSCHLDVLKFSGIPQKPPITKVTKRNVLSRIALMYDPLGLLGPVIVKSKIFLQTLWRLKLDWDETLPEYLHTEWDDYERELPCLREITVPRTVIKSDFSFIEIHGFCDASEIAYGACVYLRCVSPSKRPIIQLLTAKSRVAPLKALSIPRLELCGALLLAELVDKVKKCISLSIERTFLWTDNTIVLHWIQSCARDWTTFVANRVGTIQELTPTAQWQHIRTDDNPADPLSKGIMPSALSTNKLWWSGPNWLSFSESDWPKSHFTVDKNKIPDRKQKILVSHLSTFVEPPLDLTKYSSLTKITRFIAWWKRYIYNLRHVKNKILGPLKANELSQAQAFLVKFVQNEAFPKELNLLTNKKSLNSQSAILSLNPFLDEHGIIRVGGRLSLSSLPYNKKHPILLPKKHHFTRLVILHEHVRHFHAGAQSTLAAVRQNFWPCSGRAVVRQVLGKCLRCIRSSPKSSSNLMGELPGSRVNIPLRPFISTGVDYAGPFYHQVGTRRTAKLAKCYICIFVCFSSKAVHIEIATDLTTEAFLNAFKRFIARRGRPADVYSDNGLNFVGAANKLTELYELLQSAKLQNDLVKFSSNERINWHFIPAYSPHQGGLWEAAVKSAKKHLLRVTSGANLRYEELHTLITQIEAILNSRPIMPVSSDANDLAPLTPAHFLIGDSLTSYPEESFEETPSNRLSRWEHIEKMRQHFWKRWQNEYLHQLQQRSKWTIQNDNLKLGQIVLIKDDNLPPLSWPIGRISEIHPGKDNLVRTVTVTTSKGSYKRAITKICLLPIDLDSSLRNN